MSESTKPLNDGLSSNQNESHTNGDSNRITFLDELLIQHLPKRFTIQRVLGKGAFGVVFLARDDRFQRDVAVKILRPEWMSTPTTKNRFLRESRAAARLNHSAIVRVLEADENQAIAWQVCDAIQGISLADYLKSNRLGAFDSAKLVTKLAEAVECAHRAGVIHRDIKPENVLLKTKPNGEISCEEVFLTDFGLAKILDEEINQSRSGTILGTPRYMAPEQFEDGNARSQPSVDIFSLGIVLFECLTGHSPFEDSDSLPQRLAQSTRAHPSPRRWAPSLSIDIETICQKALNPNPSLRYASAGELASDLIHFVNGDPIKARPLNWFEKSHRFTKQNRVFVVATGIILACMSAVVAVSLQSQNEIAKSNYTLAEINGELSKAKLAAEALARDSEDLRIQSIEDGQRYQELAWSSGIREAFRNWEDSNLWEAKNSLSRLQQVHSDATNRLEWQLLTAEIDSQFAELLRLDSSIEEVRAIPNSSSIAVACGNGKVYILDSSTGALKTELHSGVRSLHAMDIHPDQSYLLIGGTTDPITDYASLLKLDLQTNELSVFATGFPTTLESICFNSNGSKVLCASRYQDVRLYDCDTREFEIYASDRRHAWLGKMSQLDSFVFQQDHFTIGFAGKYRNLEFESISMQNKNSGPIQYATVLPKLDFIIVATEDETDLLLFNSQSKNIIARLSGRTKSKVRSIATGQDGAQVIIASESGEITAWDLADLLAQPDANWSSPVTTPQTITPCGQWHISNNPIIALALMDNQVFCGTQSGNLIGFTVPHGKAKGSTEPLTPSEGSHSYNAAVGSEANSIAIRRADGKVSYLQPAEYAFANNATENQNNGMHANYRKRIADLPLVALLESGTELSGKTAEYTLSAGIAASMAGSCVWLNSQHELGVFENGTIKRYPIQVGAHSELLVIGFNLSTRTVVLRGDSYEVFLVNLDKVDDSPKSFRLNGLAGSVTWHPAGNRILIGGDFNELYEYDLLRGTIQKIANLLSPTNQVEYVADGTKAVSAHHDGTIRICDLSNRQVYTISSHYCEIRSFSVPHDARVGLSIDRENNLNLWSIPTLEKIGTLIRGAPHAQNLSQVVPDVAIAPDGRRILVVHNSGGRPVVRYWELGK